MKQFGTYLLFLSKLFVQRERLKTYIQLTLEECVYIGVNSIFLVGIVSTFIGAVTCIQTAYNLVSDFIANSVVGLIVRDMTILELAPTIISIVLAGKVGSNIAGNLGSMRITEQIDALEVMGINSISYLILPKILAAMITFPILVIIAAFLSMLGGYVAGTLSGALTPAEFVEGSRMLFVPYNVTFMIIKAVVFGFLVSSISAFQGYYTSGGAFEVGQSSTKAVTASCIAILLADYILAQLLLDHK